MNRSQSHRPPLWEVRRLVSGTLNLSLDQRKQITSIDDNCVDNRDGIGECPLRGAHLQTAISALEEQCD